MRIALLTDAWHPQTSGVVTTLTRMVQGLTERGHEILVVHPGLFPTLPCPTYPDIRLSLWPGPRLARMLRDFRPQAVHIPAEGSIGLAGRNWCARRRLPFTTAFMTRFPEYIHLRSRLPVGPVYRALRWFHGPATRTMVSTPTLRRDLEARGFGPLAIWGRGVDTELFRPRGERLIPGEAPILMYMGRVAVEKNIEAFLGLRHPGAKVVIGDGPALDKLRRKYPKALFLGRKTGQDLARHLASADVFVFPSRTDTFGIVLIEAMACGLPVAAYPVPGPADVVRHAITGWLDQDLETAVEAALSMDPAACRKHAMGFTWQRSIEQFEANLAPFDGAVSRPV